MLEELVYRLLDCWCDVWRLLDIPDHFKVVALLAVGYPREKFDFMGKALHLIRRRRKLSEIVSLEEFGKPLVNAED